MWFQQTVFIYITTQANYTDLSSNQHIVNQEVNLLSSQLSWWVNHASCGFNSISTPNVTIVSRQAYNRSMVENLIDDIKLEHLSMFGKLFWCLGLRISKDCGSVGVSVISIYSLVKGAFDTPTFLQFSHLKRTVCIFFIIRTLQIWETVSEKIK